MRIGLLALFLVVSCTPPRGTSPVSVGLPNRGYLARGAQVPDRGEGFVRALPGEETRYGVGHLVRALERAALAVSRAFPGSPPLRIGDLSKPSGGRHDRHASHRNGRDADVGFFVVDALGRPPRDPMTIAFDRFGIGRPRDSEAPLFFDAARNWHFIRTLVLDDDASVQWIFCSHGVKTRLLRYAARHETDPDAVFRATRVLHQPTTGRPHADHFHVRVLCGAEQGALGCHDQGPRWPWLRDADLKSVAPAHNVDDDGARRLLLD